MRGQTLKQLANAILTIDRPHPLRVGIDGPGASGKTTLADELANTLQSRGRPVIRAGIDDFYHPRRIRYRRGRDSVAGYLADSFDFHAIRRRLLDPLGPAGDRWFRTAHFDAVHDAPVEVAPAHAPDDAILIFEGVLALAQPLADAWDFTVYVAAERDRILQRAARRDAQKFGSPDAARRRFLQRYIPGWQRHRETIKPEHSVDALLDNTHPDTPTLTWPQWDALPA